MDNKNILFDVYYYDDNKKKHFIYNASRNDVKFLKHRFDKENVGVLNIKYINIPYTSLI